MGRIIIKFNPPIMKYNKITTQPQPGWPGAPPPPLHAQTRSFSFSQGQPVQSSPQQLQEFVYGMSMVQQLLDVGPKLGDLLMLNCADVGAVEEALRDDSLAGQIRERMAKYLRVVDVATLGYRQEEYEEVEEREELANFGVRQPNFNTTQPQIQIQTQPTEKLPKYPPPTAHQLSTSRYSTNNFSQNTVSIEIKKYKKNPSVNNNSNSVNRNGRSISNSRASESSKCFHKIQLKSVKRVDRAGKEMDKDREEGMEKKQQKIEKVEPKKPQNSNRRYTISQREREKQPKTLTSQVNNMKSTSRLRVSRVTRTQQNEQTSKSISQQKTKLLSRSKYRNTIQPVQPHRGHSPYRDKQTMKYGGKDMENAGEGGGAGTNLVMETVQKSTDFLLMLRMMNS